MSVVPFDTLAFAQKLEQGGFTLEQSRTAASALADAFTDSVATKDDIKELKSDIGNLKGEIEAVRMELGTKIEAVRMELKAEIEAVRNEMAGIRVEIGHQIQASEQRTTIRLGGMIVVGVGILLAANFFA